MVTVCLVSVTLTHTHTHTNTHAHLMKLSFLMVHSQQSSAVVKMDLVNRDLAPEAIHVTFVLLVDSIITPHPICLFVCLFY